MGGPCGESTAPSLSLLASGLEHRAPVPERVPHAPHRSRQINLPLYLYASPPSYPVQDMERQALNVFRMRLMGAEVRPVHSGTATLKDATSEAIRDWVTNVETTHYILGSAAGPHPYPMMVSGVDEWCEVRRVELCERFWPGTGRVSSPTTYWALLQGHIPTP